MKLGIVEVKGDLLSEWYREFCKEFVPLRIIDNFGVFDVICLSEHFEEIDSGSAPIRYTVTKKGNSFIVENQKEKEEREEIARLREEVRRLKEENNKYKKSIVIDKENVLRRYTTQFEETIIIRKYANNNK